MPHDLLSGFVLILGSVIMIYMRHRNDGSIDDEQDLYLIAREVSNLIFSETKWIICMSAKRSMIKKCNFCKRAVNNNNELCTTGL